MRDEYAPALSVNMSGVARAGAFSRKSMVVVLPSGKRTTMKPPPPMLPAVGCVTARAKAVATAASMALPPARMTSKPTFEPISSCVTTMP